MNTRKFRYKVILNGRRGRNGKLFSLTLEGDYTTEENFFSSASQLLDHVEEEAAQERVDIAEGVQITIQLVK